MTGEKRTVLSFSLTIPDRVKLYIESELSDIFDAITNILDQFQLTAELETVDDGPVDPPPPPPPVDPPPPPPAETVPKPYGIKLGRRDAVKKELGYRNMLNVTPLDANGEPIPVGLGLALFERYGQPLAQQSINGGPWEEVERASGDSYGCILTIVTNEPDEWESGIYKLQGEYRIRVSYPWFTFWRQQTGTMLSSGLLVGIGTDSAAENTPKDPQ